VATADNAETNPIVCGPISMKDQVFVFWALETTSFYASDQLTAA